MGQLLQEQEAENGAIEWIMAAIQSLKKASPMSLKISLRSVWIYILLRMCPVNVSRGAKVEEGNHFIYQ